MANLKGKKRPNTSVKTGVWKTNTPIERIHNKAYSGAEFNPGKGNARFSPCQNAKGKPVPTIYGGENIPVAVMETVYHDVPTGCDNQPFDLGKLDKLVYSRLIPNINLITVDINPRVLRKWGNDPKEVLLSDAENYPQTQELASQIYQDNPTAQAITWASKQHGDKAIMLFGDRLKNSDFTVSIQSQPLRSSNEVMKEIDALADEMGLITYTSEDLI
ncbi:RES family NAD+ phosphorylase [Xenorhabdus bovienii]|uniref:RES family NAD+ phosphorylase n=1 Tax=Xenorhabdus bovienii TaxID=40576 RepID=UPI00237CF1B7|nr:RES family NAD+ phosphorylase [Xenorhabdus bovienii]MDE1475852.1 RES family NAD+ phosphorylase [Xenorhabdus bovienii]MDE1483794.1 RES family NAD+ phosphorylase [Xenorhabdus bovienii]MDE9430459.1 RES family NAD+ phosphorylase [Xenorhabdus bovienii]MDE9436901.1 RES family NAD+ phosphorylase [Xenorhabdus bovienii]MDE9459080.1 RES family NAD+ phosphorylase [Xenorhabdus bovienii]